MSDAGSGSGILRLRQTILLLFGKKNLKTVCFESLISKNRLLSGRPASDWESLGTVGKHVSHETKFDSKRLAKWNVSKDLACKLGFWNGGGCARHSGDLGDEFNVANGLFHLADDERCVAAVLSLHATGWSPQRRL